MNPSDFSKIKPWNSIFHKSEAETIALNIMKILARTGNKFRELSYEEYEKERIKDGNYADWAEKPYFEMVIKYCSSAEMAKKFSLDWKI